VEEIKVGRASYMGSLVAHLGGVTEIILGLDRKKDGKGKNSDREEDLVGTERC
jgi:hypothetical protein